MPEKGNTLLVVDDDEMNRNLLSGRLKRLGFSVTTASSGTEALEIYRDKDIDLVLLDVEMPEMDGLEVLSIIRETHSLVELPVIMMTARDQSGDVVAALQLGANDYVTKPPNFPVIFARIQTHLSIKQLKVAPTPLADVLAQQPAGSSVNQLNETTPPPDRDDYAFSFALTSSDAGKAGTAAGDSGDESGSFSFLLPPVESDEMGRLGNFRVLGELGTGGMGIVFHAEDIALRRPVALKVIKPGLNYHSGVVNRFLREARTMAAIKHRHLVTIYQAGQENNVVYLAMELLEGMSLEDWIDHGPTPEFDEAARLGHDIASGLAAIHKHGVIHRDLKPANIWLEAPDEHVKILDFGLARDIKDDTRLTQSGIIIGTPSFMSPEQARGEKLDPRSDLFNLGCILYLLCTNQRPFAGENTMALLTALAVDTPCPVQEINPAIPEPMSDLINRLLAKKAADRPESAEYVVEQLRLFRGEAKK